MDSQKKLDRNRNNEIAMTRRGVEEFYFTLSCFLGQFIKLKFYIFTAIL